MDIKAAFEAFATQGIDVAEYFYRHVSTPQKQRDWAHVFGESKAKVRQLAAMSRRFFAKDPVRAQAVARARENKLSLATLMVISTGVSHLNKQAAKTEPELLLELVDFARDKDVDLIKTHVRARVKQLNGGKKEPWRRWVRCSKHPDANGMRYIMAKLDDATVASIQNALEFQARKLRTHNQQLSHQQAMADVFASQMLTGGVGASEQKREGLILLPADGMRHIGDGLLATTDGAQIPVAELASQLLADFGYAIVYDEQCEPVDLFRTRRLANTKQRLMLAADQLLCVDPTCERPAISCQAHHLEAWQQGGETNLVNLVAACATHNALNDDNKQCKRNGYYARDPVTGRAGYMGPEEEELEFNEFPVALKSGRMWAVQHFAAARV
ncbi:MAG: HNH endonuclease signature motif containing protein [Corynebacterium sp.]|nr:HNH endonuclease signature motif containing protein [Corynebacterium sp.]